MSKFVAMLKTPRVKFVASLDEKTHEVKGSYPVAVIGLESSLTNPHELTDELGAYVGQPVVVTIEPEQGRIPA